MKPDLTHIRETLITRIETQLKLILNIKTPALNLIEAMQYSTLNSGKRIRPLLCFAGGMISQAEDNTILQVGAALELIHCYSLIHDDLPSMDNDDLRRGKPTCHKKFNEALAILAGDALQTLAFSVLSHTNLKINNNIKIRIINLLANLSGVDGMVGGQALDYINTGLKITQEQLQLMHSMKTGALIKASILSGYLCGSILDESEFNKLEYISEQIGLLFQIKDDILDATVDTQTLGKTANKDLNADKATYVSILGIDKAEELAQAVYHEVINQLKVSEHYQLLLSLTDTIFNRNN